MDQDSKEILAEMEAEGIDTSELTQGQRVAPAEKKEEEEETDDSSKEEEEEEESGSKEDQESAEETAEEEEEDESSDDSEEEEDDDAEEEDESESKGKRLTLVQKYRKEKKARQALEHTIEVLKAAKNDESFDTELKTFAEKNNLSLDVARGLVDFAARKAGLPKDLLEDIQRSRQERRDTQYWQQQHKDFNKDFQSNVLPVLEQMGLDEEAIKATYETLNADEKSPFWAWEKKNKSQSLVKLALSINRTGGKKGNRVSSESSRASLNRGKSQKEASDMTPEDINEMSDAEFDAFSDKLAKGSKSVVHRS